MATNNENNSGNFLLTFLAGAAAGAVIGLLYAPDKGSETRKKISEKSRELTDDLQETTNMAIDTINDLRERIMDVISDVTEGSLGQAAFDSLSIRGNWNDIKGQLKKKFSQLTDDDLTFVEGKENELVGRLQKKLGKTKDQIIDLINSFTSEKSHY
jgi:uncharacterized protein YjbJ (UPF0337 family)